MDTEPLNADNIDISKVLHCKKKSEIFPDYNWIAPCIPAGCGFLSHGYLSNSIWNWIQLYLDSYPTTKNDLN